MDANGIKATLMLMQVFIDEMKPPEMTDPEEINAFLSQEGYLCCKLGDQRMFDLWGECGPE
jgi:hypothetical protein